jgi:hypothetical protein
MHGNSGLQLGEFAREAGDFRLHSRNLPLQIVLLRGRRNRE